MCRLMYGSGKFSESVSGYSETKGLSENKVVPLFKSSADMGQHVDDLNPDDKENPQLIASEPRPSRIPPKPENPDVRPKFIQYAEEYFGKYWFLMLLLVLYLLRKK